MRLYGSIILSTLLYSAELRPLTATLSRRLDAAHHRWQGSILGVSILERQGNKVRVRNGQQSIGNILSERRLCWLGHTLRMDHHDIPQQALCVSEVPGFKRGPAVGQGQTEEADRCSQEASTNWTHQQPSTDKNGVGVWPNTFTWTWDESRS